MMITDIEDYFTKGCGRCPRFDTPECATRLWQPGLLELRRICRSTGMAETVKWAHPVYMHAGRNIVIIGALRGDFRLGFFQPALMKDPERRMERQGPNTKHPDVLRFADAGQVLRDEALILAYLAEAMGYAAAGITAPKETTEMDLPDELIEAMDADPELAEAFHRLTPGRQRSYVFALTSTKTPATRFARIERYRPHILAGKGALER